MALVIMLAVASVASVVTIIHSIDLTVFTLYGYNRYLTGVTPRNALYIDDDEMARIKRIPELGLVAPSHSYQTMVKTIFGKMVFPIFGMDAPGRAMIMERTGVTLASGRMVQDGKPEAVISEDVARNLGIKIGEILSNPDSADSYAPVPIRLVGTLKGSVWLGLTSKQLVDASSPFSFRGAILFSRSSKVSEQRKLDKSVARLIDKGRTREWQYSGLVNETRSALANLYLIMNLVVGIIVFAISFVCGLLSNIYFTQRLPEIATLAAIGYRRRFLMARAVGETTILCAVGWLMGALFTTALLKSLYQGFMRPRGLLLETFDLRAFGLTLPLPLAIIGFAFCTIAWRLTTLDPVSIIERRA